MPEIGHVRKLGTVDFAAGSRQTLELDRTGVLMGLDLRVQFTITNGGTGPVGPFFEALARIVKRVEIILGGRDTVISMSGAALAAKFEYENMQPADGMDDTVVLTNSAVTAYDITLPLQFFLPDGRREDDTALDLRRVSQATLAITWGAVDCSEQFTTPNSAAISLVTCSVEGQYILSDNPDRQYLVRSMNTLEKTITASSDAFDMILDRNTGLFYRSAFIIATDADIGDDAVLNDISLQSGTFIFQHTEPAKVKARNRQHRKLSSLKTGVYDMPVTVFGQGATMLNTGEMQSDFKFVFDVTVGSGTTKLLIVREALRPVKLA